MSTTLAERLVNKVALRRTGTSRRSFMGGAALVGAALAVDPWSYLTRPANAYDAVCGADNTCASGYTVFCCTINGGSNTCPPDSFVGGWWKADNSSFCGGSARYYIDCNAYRDGHYACHCNQTTCDQRRVACNQFRYGQCNTQIPYSNTGPVLCRVISCTPPWVQYGTSCSSSSATDNNTATHSAPCLTGHPPRGHLDSATVAANLVRLSGWAYDPDQPATSIRIVIYADGVPLTVIAANGSRPDVDAALHITGNHGFSVPIAATTGRHSYAAYAINVAGGSGNVLLGATTVDVNPGSAPQGHLDSAVAKDGVVTLSGWAFDRDQPGTSVRLVIHVDGKPYGVTTTNTVRADVNAAFHLTGAHGYSVRVPAQPGRHRYQVYAMNLGGGSGNPLVGDETVTVAAGSTAAGSEGASSIGAGALESGSSVGNAVRLAGWVSAPGAQLLVTEDDRAVHWMTTDNARADGTTGFDVALTTGAGVHRYAVYAVLGDQITPLGERSVAVDHDGPLGHATIAAVGGSLRVTGWTYDPRRPADELTARVFCDGSLLSRHRGAGVSRPDVNRDYGAAGDPGFEFTIEAELGRHTYAVYASTATGDSLLGSATVEGSMTNVEPVSV